MVNSNPQSGDYHQTIVVISRDQLRYQLQAAFERSDFGNVPQNHMLDSLLDYVRAIPLLNDINLSFGRRQDMLDMLVRQLLRHYRPDETPDETPDDVQLD